jgi:hypothetical protein
MKFITVWETENDDDEITIEADKNNYDFDFTVDWGDGNTETYEDATIASDNKIIHKYDTNGSYTVKISGDFPHVRINTKQLKKITQWGDIVVRSFYDAFYRCKELNVTAVDTPDLRNVRTTNGLFGYNFDINEHIKDWDVSAVTDFSYTFYATSNFNISLNDWDVSSATNMEGMFYWAKIFNQPLDKWDVVK